MSDFSFFDCLDTVLDKSNLINESVTDISTSMREGNHERFCDSIRNLSSGITILAECSAHAAYLVGVSDPRSDPAIPGLVDQGQFARAQHSISLACQTLLNPGCSQQQVLASATAIAKHTSHLCTVCKSASNNTTNPVAKKHFMNSAKDVSCCLFVCLFVFLFVCLFVCLRVCLFIFHLFVCLFACLSVVS